MGLVEAPGMADGAQALVMARPEHILVGEAALETGASFAGNVSFARWLGRTALIEVRLETGEAVFARISDKNWPGEGEAVEVALDPEHVHVFAGDRDAAPVISDMAKRGGANTSESLAFSG
jgi:ABC-type sugar transport system ATPase subunit